MKVIMKDTNEVKDVAFGYAVNFLIPKGKAELATEAKLKEIEEEKKKKQQKREKEQKKNKKIADKIDGREIKIKKKTGKSGKLFGSVSDSDIKKAVGEKKLDVELEKPIKETGDYQVNLKIGNQRAKIKVIVEKREEK
jgi:large subunit ribosomal protein L9